MRAEQNEVSDVKDSVGVARRRRRGRHIDQRGQEAWRRSDDDFSSVGQGLEMGGLVGARRAREERNDLNDACHDCEEAGREEMR